MEMIDLQQTPSPFPQPQTAYVASGAPISPADPLGDSFERGMVVIGVAALLLFSMLRR